MDVARLESMRAAALATDDFDVHAQFVKALLGERDIDGLEYHYQLLADRGNRDLYQRIRLGLIKRDKAVVPFLLGKLNEERDLSMRKDLLHILGRLRAPEALEMARAEIRSDDVDMRHRACYVIGWMGDVTDVALLREVLLGDSDEYVRRTAATSHSQMWERMKDLAEPLLANLRDALLAERSDEVAKWIVVTTQYVSGKRFGLRENIEEGVVVGDVEAAIARCRKFFSTQG